MPPLLWTFTFHGAHKNERKAWTENNFMGIHFTSLFGTSINNFKCGWFDDYEGKSVTGTLLNYVQKYERNACKKKVQIYK